MGPPTTEPFSQKVVNAPKKTLLDPKKAGYEPFDFLASGRYLPQFLIFTPVADAKECNPPPSINRCVTVGLALSGC
jgi:hypothetical protein